VLDPFAGTGTTAVTALQLQRKSISIEIDPANVECIRNRLKNIREADLLQKYYKDYVYTENLATIWGDELEIEQSPKKLKQEKLKLFNAVS
jgi:tRNA G10  N-methylase Trm11